MTRILWWSPPWWSPSGYGVQTKLIVPELKAQGHEIACGFYAGCHRADTWHTKAGPVPILGNVAGRARYGNGMIPYFSRKWGADIIIMMCDAFSLEPTQFGGLNVMPWMPIDCDPISEPDRVWLHMTEQAGATVSPIAMSLFGQEKLKEIGVDAKYIPHCYDPEVYFPDPVGGATWRKDLLIPDNMFLISICGVSRDKNDRKNLVPQMLAFKKFSDKYPDTAMYMHTEAQYNDSNNLIKAAIDLKLQKRIMFADEERRAADDYDETYMRGMYNASNLYTQCSKGEGFGVNVIEAMGCGVPVVVSDFSAQKELVPPGTGWRVGGDLTRSLHLVSWWLMPDVYQMFRAYEKAYLIWKNTPGQWERMQKQCITHVSKYTVEEVGRMWQG